MMRVRKKLQKVPQGRWEKNEVSVCPCGYYRTQSDIIKFIMPSKKVTLIAIACIVVIVSIFLVSRPKSMRMVEVVENASEPQIVMNEAIKSTSNTDTDGDGLKDWEEVLWKTDPLQKDTDKDGINDAQEVQTQKNSQSGGTSLSGGASGSGIFQQSQTTTPENLTLTDKIAQDTFAEYIKLKQSGQPVDAVTTEKIVQSILGNNPLAHSFPKFNKTNLTNIVDLESEPVIRAYGNNLWDIMIRNTPKNVVLENEYIILLTAIQTQNEKELVRLDPIIKGYADTIKEMLTMPVPYSATAVHLDLLNNMSIILSLTQDMKVFFTDPARGFGALAYYKSNVLNLQGSLQTLISYFDTKNILYVETESGYRLTHSI
jgi:hypothetical protein